MTAYHRTAEAALADKTPGAKSLQATLPEALKLSGQQHVDVNGRPAWFAVPCSTGPGQRHDDPLAVWHVGLSLDKATNDRIVADYRAAHPNA